MNISQGNHTSEIWVSATRPNSLISPQFPDFRFSCRRCGSLDVFLKTGKKSTMTCLDCRKREIVQ